LEVDLEDQGPDASGTEDGTCNIGCFEDIRLPECLRGSWVNANKIVDLQGTANHPNDPSKKVVISLSGPTTHTVQTSKNRKNLTCDNHCPRYKEMAICCHTIAITHNEGFLIDFVSSYALLLIVSFVLVYLLELARRPMSVDPNENDPTIPKRRI